MLFCGWPREQTRSNIGKKYVKTILELENRMHRWVQVRTENAKNTEKSIVCCTNQGTSAKMYKPLKRWSDIISTRATNLMS